MTIDCPRCKWSIKLGRQTVGQSHSEYRGKCTHCDLLVETDDYKLTGRYGERFNYYVPWLP